MRAFMATLGSSYMDPAMRAEFIKPSFCGPDEKGNNGDISLFIFWFRTIQSGLFFSGRTSMHVGKLRQKFF